MHPERRQHKCASASAVRLQAKTGTHRGPVRTCPCKGLKLALVFHTGQRDPWCSDGACAHGSSAVFLEAQIAELTAHKAVHKFQSPHTLKLAASDTFPDPFFRTATLIVSVQEPGQILRRLSCWFQSMHGTVCIRAAGLDGILQAGAFGSLSRGNLPSFWLNAACHTCLLACFFFLVDCTHMWPQHLGHTWPFRQRFSFGSRCIPECT